MFLKVLQQKLKKLFYKHKNHATELFVVAKKSIYSYGVLKHYNYNIWINF